MATNRQVIVSGASALLVLIDHALSDHLEQDRWIIESVVQQLIFELQDRLPEYPPLDSDEF